MLPDSNVKIPDAARKKLMNIDGGERILGIWEHRRAGDPFLMVIWVGNSIKERTINLSSIDDNYIIDCFCNLEQGIVDRYEIDKINKIRPTGFYGGRDD